MKISRTRLRNIIKEVILKEQDDASCDRLLAAVLASESPNDSEGMRAVYDVIQTRADYEFKELPAGDIRAQITAKGQFSGYNKFKNTAPFIEYYSGIAPDSAYSVGKEKIATEKFLRKKQFNSACEAIKKGPKGSGATHFVNPARASTENKWWEEEYDPVKKKGFIKADEVGAHIFGWDMSVSQARDAYNYNKRKK